MTMREWIIKRLISDGLWEDQAKAVMSRLESGDTGKVMNDRWGDSIDQHPETLLAVLYMAARREAVGWIDENRPHHFARPMFARD